ncbi:MAG: DUF2318 domain-containing protein [Geobacteraceae bacterium]|nr:DUF2318 domain-containing protein [Geobacteraceae bacterium]
MGKKFVRYGVLAGVVLLLGVGAVFAITFPGLGKSEKVKAVNGAVSIPLAKAGDGKAHYYRFEADGKEIAFFLVKAGDGTIRSAFDACDVCYREKKGYEQQGDKMVCKNCNMKFATNRIGPHAVGGCNPSYLPHAEAGGNAVIRVEDLKAGARFF